MNSSESSGMASEATSELALFQSVANVTCMEGSENMEDYETQLLGFTPKSFVSGIYNAVSEYFMEALQVFEEFLEKKYGDLLTPSQVAEKMTSIRKHLVTQIDKAFDTLETYLGTNVLVIPPSVVLPEDQVQMDEPVSAEEGRQLLQDVEDAKRRILAVKLANTILKQRIENAMELNDTFDSVVEELDLAQNAVRQEGVADPRDSLRHCANRVLGTLRLLQGMESLDSQMGPSFAKRPRISAS